MSYELEIELDDAPQYARSVTINYYLFYVYLIYLLLLLKLLTQEGAMSALSGVWTLIQVK